MKRKINGAAVQRMRKYGFGQSAEPAAETWDERQARVEAERAERQAQREAGESE